MPGKRNHLTVWLAAAAKKKAGNGIAIVLKSIRTKKRMRGGNERLVVIGPRNYYYSRRTQAKVELQINFGRYTTPISIEYSFGRPEFMFVFGD